MQQEVNVVRSGRNRNEGWNLLGRDVLLAKSTSRDGNRQDFFKADG
jgi:hypothetical protein